MDGRVSNSNNSISGERVAIFDKLYLPVDQPNVLYTATPDGLMTKVPNVQGYLYNNGSGAFVFQHIDGDDIDVGEIAFSDVGPTTASRVAISGSDGYLQVANDITTTELSYLDGVTSNIQTQLGTKANDSDTVHISGSDTITGIKTFSANPLLTNITASRALYVDGTNTIAGSATTSTELGYISGVTSAIQTQLNTKALDSAVCHNTGSETWAGVKDFSNAPTFDYTTASRVAYFTGTKQLTSSTITDTELNYLSGSTSNIQTQINNKANDSEVVHYSGTENIGGPKTFIVNPIIDGNASSLVKTDTNIALDTITNANGYLYNNGSGTFTYSYPIDSGDVSGTANTLAAFNSSGELASSDISYSNGVASRIGTLGITATDDITFTVNGYPNLTIEESNTVTNARVVCYNQTDYQEVYSYDSTLEVHDGTSGDDIGPMKAVIFGPSYLEKYPPKNSVSNCTLWLGDPQTQTTVNDSNSIHSRVLASSPTTGNGDGLVIRDSGGSYRMMRGGSHSSYKSNITYPTSYDTNFDNIIPARFIHTNDLTEIGDLTGAYKYGFISDNLGTDVPSELKIYNGKNICERGILAAAWLKMKYDLVDIRNNQTLDGTKTFTLNPIHNALTASTVPYIDENKKLASSVVTPIELGYVSGVTSVIQTQINNKANDSSVCHNTGVETWNGSKTFTTPPSFNMLESGRAAIIDVDKKINVVSTTNTELSYVHGVTSSIQTQINTKADDSLVCHLSGTETITGNKIFTNDGTSIKHLKMTNSVENKISCSNTLGSYLSVNVGNGSGTTKSCHINLTDVEIANTVDLRLNKITASKALYVDASNRVQSSNVTNTELSYLSGLTGNVSSVLTVNSTTPILTVGTSGELHFHRNNGDELIKVNTSGSSNQHGGISVYDSKLLTWDNLVKSMNYTWNGVSQDMVQLGNGTHPLLLGNNDDYTSFPNGTVHSHNIRTNNSAVGFTVKVQTGSQNAAYMLVSDSSNRKRKSDVIEITEYDNKWDELPIYSYVLTQDKQRCGCENCYNYGFMADDCHRIDPKLGTCEYDEDGDPDNFYDRSVMAITWLKCKNLDKRLKIIEKVLNII